MEFERFKTSHKSLLIKWSKDPTTLEHLGGMIPLDDFIDFLLSAENRLTYIVIHNSKKIGMVDVEFYPKEKNAAMSILVAPRERGKGFGKLALEKLVQTSDFKKYNQLDAFIAPTNMASIKCFQKANFKQIRKEVDEDGLFRFSYFFKNKPH